MKLHALILVAVLLGGCATTARGPKYGDTNFGPRPGGGGGGGSGITQLTGAVTAGPGSGSQAATIAAGAVTLGMQANLAANSIPCNNTGSPATQIACSATQATAMLNVATESLPGLLGSADKTKLDGIVSTTAAGELAWCQANISTTLTRYVLMMPGDFVAGSANTGTVTYGGVGTQVATGTTTNKLGQTVWKTVNGAAFLAPSSAGGKFCTTWSGRLVGASDAQSEFRVGLADGTDNLTAKLIGSVSTTTWQFIGTRGATFTIAGTGAGATADFAANHLLSITSDGTNLTLWIDHVSIATTTSLSATCASSMFPQQLTKNGTTAANREFDTDFFFAAFPPN